MGSSRHQNDARDAKLLTEGSAESLAVATAAIRIGEAVFTLPRPNRHHNIIWWLSALGVKSRDTHVQGFVLNNGCYVDRVSAAHYATLAGQLTKPLIAPPNLYSEDLWDGGRDMPRPADIAALASGPSPPSEELGAAGPDRTRDAPLLNTSEADEKR